MIDKVQPNSLLKEFINTIYLNCNLTFKYFTNEEEGKDYNACSFFLNDTKIICRNAKKTPIKSGQFVTFWKRNKQYQTAPFQETDNFKFFVINTKSDNRIGQFVFPKSELIRRRIVSTTTREGKRGFRVYPIWDTPSSLQAQKTQNWQLKYFYEKTSTLNSQDVKALFL